MTFPTVNGSNLQRAKLTLPQDFAGDYNLLFIAFHQWHQDEVNTWIPLAESCEAQYPGLVYYELPTIRSLNALSKFFINEGMRAGIPNPKARERTVTLYIDLEKFMRALSIPTKDEVHVLLVDRQGSILWRTTGSFDEAKGSALAEAIVAHLQRADSSQ